MRGPVESVTWNEMTVYVSSAAPESLNAVMGKQVDFALTVTSVALA